MNRLKKITGLFLLLFSLTAWVQEQAEAGKKEDDFSFKQVTTSKKKRYLLIKAKFKTTLKEAKEIKIKFYAQKKKKTAVGEKTKYDLKKNRIYLETGVIIPADLKIMKGTPAKYRVEIWYEDELAASITKPKSSEKEKWWEAEEVMSLIKTDTDVKIKRIIRDLR